MQLEISKVKQAYNFRINVRNKNISSQLLQSGKMPHSLDVDASFWAATLETRVIGANGTQVEWEVLIDKKLTEI